MPIQFNKETGIIQIDTDNTSYQMKIDMEKNLLHTYYGAKIDCDDMSVNLFKLDRGFSGNPHDLGAIRRDYSLDVLPQEYSCFGTGDYRITGLHVREENGARVSGLKYQDCSIENKLLPIDGLPAVYEEDGKERKTLCITMKDPVNGLTVELRYAVIEESDIIARSAILTNSGNERLYLEKAASMNLDLPFGDYDWITFYGRHAMERNFTRRSIEHGISSIGSVRGTSSHHYNPFSVICSKDATEFQGDCYGFSFAYSGEFLMEAEKDQADQVRFVCGIHPDDFTWALEKDESFATPQVIMTYSENGFSKMSQNLHNAISEHIVRGVWKHKRRPVLINNWEATFFDFTGDKLVEIAKDAKSLGVEMFVMDDGWFGNRDSDNRGLGDWYPNEKKLGCTLHELGKRITDLGMKFGIWFEPEMISEDSDLYRNHPDWALIAPGRSPELSRHQLVLDMTRPEVVDYIIERMSSVLSESPISYVKWDMNRSVCDKFSHYLDKEHMGELSHRYVLGVYRILETLHEKFPEVLFEGCSGGGGRFDAGMLYYTPQIWCSDNTDAIARLSIQYGTSFCYPAASMGAHVSVVPNQQTGRTSPLSTRAAVAMAGTFGYELDITKMEPDEREAVRKQIEFFKKYADLMHEGDYYRLTTPKDIATIWEMTDKDGKEALITVVYHGVESNPAPVHIKVPGLAPDKKYKAEYIGETADLMNFTVKDPVMTGRSFAKSGMTVRMAPYEFGCYQIHITEV